MQRKNPWILRSRAISGLTVLFVVLTFGCEGAERIDAPPQTFAGDAGVDEQIAEEQLASTFIGRFRFRNNQGYCVIRGGRGYALTQPCSTDSREVFDIHQTSDGLYNLCEVGTTSCLSNSHVKFLGFTNLSLSVGRFRDMGNGHIAYPGKTGVLYRTAESGGGGYLRLGAATMTADRLWSITPG